MRLLHANDPDGAHAPSWYAATADAPAPMPALCGHARADVCVVGGGYTGLSAALHLAQRGVDVVLLEAHRLGFGASGRNGGQVGSGQRRSQRDLEAIVGPEDAAHLWRIGEAAKAKIKGLATDHDIDCGWRAGVAGLVRLQAAAEALRDEPDWMADRYGYDRLEWLDADGAATASGSPCFAGGILDHGAGHIHPLRLAFGLARAAQAAGVRLHERSEVTRVDDGPDPVARTRHGIVRADHIVLAANGYLDRLDRRVAARVMPINNYMVATEPLGALANTILPRDIAAHDDQFIVNYWRKSDDGRLLFGGGESYGDRFPSDIEAVVRRPLRRIYPQLADTRIDHTWGGTLGITRSRLPVFDRPAPGIWACSGYSGHGVALAVLAGEIVADAIAGATERFDVMARLPVPSFPGGSRLRRPLLTLAMTWYLLRDRFGL